MEGCDCLFQAMKYNPNVLIHRALNSWHFKCSMIAGYMGLSLAYAAVLISAVPVKSSLMFLTMKTFILGFMHSLFPFIFTLTMSFNLFLSLLIPIYVFNSNFRFFIYNCHEWHRFPPSNHLRYFYQIHRPSQHSGFCDWSEFMKLNLMEPVPWDFVRVCEPLVDITGIDLESTRQGRVARRARWRSISLLQFPGPLDLR